MTTRKADAGNGVFVNITNRMIYDELISLKKSVLDMNGRVKKNSYAIGVIMAIIMVLITVIATRF